MTAVRLGIDRLLENPEPIAGQRVGLITNPSGVTSQGVPTWEALLRHPEVRLVKLFGPEHGVDGGAIYMEAVEDAIHPPSGLPVFSLYGNSIESLKPKPEQLTGLDALVFDVADVGARYYTYAWTMLLALEAAERARLRMVVCDRPNPIGGSTEGAPQEEEYLSFVGLHPIAIRHGMTLAEMARLLVAERRFDVDLSVAPLTGWTRETPYAATGLPWVSPSPNIPSPRTALVYPGMCFLEGTNISEGRGTTRPFELFGAPWLDARAFAGALNDSGLPGARFIPTHFRPQFDKHAGTTCAGALLEVTDPGQFRAVETGMRVIEAARRLVPNRFAWRTEPYEFDPRPAIDLLTGSPRFRQAVDAGSSLDAELARHRGGAREFESRRVPHLLYADRRPAVLLFCGGHGSGKTTLLTRLLPRLLATGLRVGAVKHTSKDAPDDIEGKDSARLAESGACAVAFVTPRRATGRRFGTEESLETILSREFSDCDLVLVEGYKDRDGFPKIEVTRSGAARPRVSGAQLRIHDGFASPDEVPSLHFDELERIVEAILRIAGLQRGA